MLLKCVCVFSRNIRVWTQLQKIQIIYSNIIANKVMGKKGTGMHIVAYDF